MIKSRSTGFRLALQMLVVSALVAYAPSALACATCYGQSDSPLAAGMNWGILTMIVVAYGVLLSIAGFFVFLARRAASVAAMEAAEANTSVEATENFQDTELCSQNS